jgi:hypothetical protein
MKLALKILNYVIGSVMFIGMIALSAEYDLDASTFIFGLLIVGNSVLTLVYLSKN